MDLDVNVVDVFCRTDAVQTLGFGDAAKEVYMPNEVPSHEYRSLELKQSSDQMLRLTLRSYSTRLNTGFN